MEPALVRYRPRTAVAHRKKAEDREGGAAHSAEPDRALGLQEPSRRLRPARCPFSECKRNTDEYPPRLVRSGGGRSEGLRLHLAQESAHLRFPAGDGRGRHTHHRAAHGPRYTTDVHEVRPLESGSQSSSGRSAGYFRRQTDTKADTRKTLRVKSFRIICESGEIGRRTRLRIWRGNPWGFKSPLSHQFPLLYFSGECTNLKA